MPGISAGLPAQGCVFEDREPILDFASDSKFAAIANHIRQAQMSDLPGAGRLYASGPLTRMVDFRERRRNGRRACPSSRYSLTGYSCDEYPFRSTYQGAAQPSGVILPQNGRTFPGCNISDLPRVEQGRTGATGYSVCMVDVQANDDQGIAIGSFYYLNRVFDGDEFYVRADPQWTTN